MKFNLKFSLSKILSFSFSLIFLSIIFLNTGIKIANADFNNLKPCKESSAFQKRLTSSIKKLETRFKLYIPDSTESKFLLKEIALTKTRFKKYENSNLLCGKDGLPHIIVSISPINFEQTQGLKGFKPLNHANEFIIPGLLFLYITGWIGWVGRKYIHYASTTENAFENEIIINVPVAISIMNSGFLWPIDAWKEFLVGELLESDNEITVSPR
jgi:photosystem I subunit 3